MSTADSTNTYSSSYDNSSSSYDEDEEHFLVVVLWLAFGFFFCLPYLRIAACFLVWVNHGGYSRVMELVQQEEEEEEARQLEEARAYSATCSTATVEEGEDGAKVQVH